MRINKGTISDKIYFHLKDAEGSIEELEKLFCYYWEDDYFGCIDILTKDNEGNPDLICVPTGALSKLTFNELIDKRTWDKLTYEMQNISKLTEDQKRVVYSFQAGRTVKSGTLEADCGWGKTYAAASLISHANVKTLVLVDKKLLLNQWVDAMSELIPNVKIGKIGDGYFELGDITIAIYISANNNMQKIKNLFSLVIVDECHSCPADLFSSTLNALTAKIKIGMSATHTRRDGRHLLLPDYFSNFHVAAEEQNKIVPRVLIVQTDIPFRVNDPKREWAKALTKLCTNSTYHNLISEKANILIANGRCPLILTERLAMHDVLIRKIEQAVRLIGRTIEEERKEILSLVGSRFKAILSTTLFDKGVSCHRLDTLFLTCPISAKSMALLKQRIGRIRREHPDKKDPLVVDFWLKGYIVENQQRTRYQWYMEQGYEIQTT